MVRSVIDLFCGAGGLSEGFRQAGYHVAAGNDYDTAAGETFARTHADAKFLPGPIENITPREFLKSGGLKPGQLDVLIGGPPCQGFSVYNHQRGMHDQRSSLYLEYLRIVEGLKPRWVVLENVTGISSASGGEAVRSIIKGFSKLGYRVEAKTLKAEQYGVPQERRRILFVGNRVGLPIGWPEPTHGEGLKPLVNVRDAIGDLPILENGEELDGGQYKKAPKSE
jgi:DNA (cytosine-5)-methyltransferase 1